MKKINIFLVGGAIRDKLLFYFVREYDWTVLNSNFYELKKYKFFPIGKEFTIFLNCFTKEEYSLSRDININNKKKKLIDLSSHVYFNLNNNLLNRDLTINSFILSENGRLFDFFNSLYDLHNGLLKCVSFLFFFDKIRIFRIMRFLTKYYLKFFNINFFDIFLIRYYSLSFLSFNFTIERVIKEIYSVLNNNYFFLFFECMYIYGLLNIFFKDLHKLYLLSNLFKFNFYINLIKNIYNIIKFIFINSNNNLLKFSIFFLYINYNNFLYSSKIFKYNSLRTYQIEEYRKKFIFSKKYCKFLYFLSIFYKFYKKLFLIKLYLLFFIILKMNFIREKIKFLNILLICLIDLKINSLVNYFYFKYFLLDILTDLDLKFKKNKNLDFLIIKKIILFYKIKYNKFYFII